MNPKMCETALKALVTEHDLELASQRIDWANFVLFTPDGELSVAPQIGCMPGDPLIVSV